MYKVTIVTMVNGEKHEQLFCKLGDGTDIVSSPDQCSLGYFVFIDYKGQSRITKLSQHDRLEINPC